MKDALVIFGISVAAIAIGAVLYFNNVGNDEIPDFNPEAEVPSVPATGVQGPILYTVIGQGVRASGVSDRKNYAVRDEEGFADLWQKVHGSDGQTRPDINFDEYQVIGVFAGIRPTGGYAISVIAVEDTETERIVTIALTSPGEDCMVTQALTNPYQLIRLPASDLPLKREYVEEIRACS